MSNDSERIAPFEYKPDYAVPPGETIQEMLEAKGILPARAAGELGYSVADFNQIIQGKRAITTSLAFGLQELLGIPMAFWRNLERNYRRNLERLEKGDS